MIFYHAKYIRIFICTIYLVTNIFGYSFVQTKNIRPTLEKATNFFGDSLSALTGDINCNQAMKRHDPSFRVGCQCPGDQSQPDSTNEHLFSAGWSHSTLHWDKLGVETGDKPPDLSHLLLFLLHSQFCQFRSLRRIGALGSAVQCYIVVLCCRVIVQCTVLCRVVLWCAVLCMFVQY